MVFNKRVTLIVMIVCCVSSVAYCAPNVVESLPAGEDASVAEGRTFGHHFLKRISFAIIPAAFVVGVITTLLAALTVVSMKGLGVGIILLVLAVGQMIARSIPQAVSAGYAAAPVPIVYSSHRATADITNPVWLEKAAWR